MRLALLILFFASTSIASEMRTYARSPRAVLMGDAFTSIAEDEYTLFYNPAALARNRGVELTFINPQIGVTNALDDLDRFEDLPKDAPGIVNRFQGFPVFAQIGIAPGFKLGNFGLSFIANNSTSVILRNSVYPSLDVDYRYDKGVVLGYAHKISDSSFGKTSVGVSFKSIKRQGLANSFDLFGTRLLNIISDDIKDVDVLKDRLGYSHGRAYGYDFGILHTMGGPSHELAFGLSIMDIADTRFKVFEGTQPIADQEMSVNFGASFRQKWGFFNQTLSLDVKPINEPIDFGRKIHMGYRLSFLMFEGMVGISEGYLSYGAGLNLGFIHLMAGFYSKEIGARYKEEKGSRAVISLNLLNMDFALPSFAK